MKHGLRVTSKSMAIQESFIRTNQLCKTYYNTVIIKPYAYLPHNNKTHIHLLFYYTYHSYNNKSQSTLISHNCDDPNLLGLNRHAEFCTIQHGLSSGNKPGDD